jgi:hypothetical protein
MAIRRQAVVMTFAQSRAQEERIMSATTTSRTRRIISRITATWSELDHAQRRLLEIQTGTTGLTRAQRTQRPEPRL